MGQWYYIVMDETQGPVDDQQLTQLVRRGDVTPATQVREAEGYELSAVSDGLAAMKKRPPYNPFALILLAFWPLWIVHLVLCWTKREQVMLSLLPNGDVEATGYTLEALHRDRRHGRIGCFVMLLIAALLLLLPALLRS